MIYSITELAKLAGISTRTLRFYDKKELLTAQRNSDNNYRYYNEADVDRLQKIMFLRLFDLPLNQIRKILASSEMAQYHALNSQRQYIIAEQKRLTALLANLDQTLATMKGGSPMNNLDKFAAFKTKTIRNNELRYGKEIRDKYSDAIIDKSNQKFKSLAQTEITTLEKLTDQILSELKPLVGAKNLNQPAAKHLFDLHKKFLLITWPEDQYSSEAHIDLAIMYVSDPRFTRYYEEGTGKKGAAATLKDIIAYYA
ncbi:MerR family transcriptional regulator [Liquorilactobacillus capillatus]|uniref:MerR family transcriptional regulator n=1 Tax=Liquorilactobacillus capillatus DSM 19910 TaxID=1423731 RepID=A0A0R1MBJ2_9LACO|nr:MerR family transcriptional regulator [Liquorilactobacillus capillatus]KRL02482.1 MerR family transcriptional regulator [Liquorilactobacillus capillatus DSM 19910]